MTTLKNLLWLLIVLPISISPALAHMGIETSEFQARRLSVMNAVPDGIMLVHSFSAPKYWSDAGFRQDSNFFYLTGLENLHDAILALDGTTKETWLFVKPPTEREQKRFSIMTGWDSVFLTADSQTEHLLGIDHIVMWDGFSKFIEGRRKANPKIVLYVYERGEGNMVADVSNPPDLAPVENYYLLWSRAIQAKWPDGTIVNAAPTLENVRAVKSPAEIALLKRAGEYTAASFRAAMAATAPGRTNRQIEGAAIEAALRAGADGVSMWPELKSGPVSGESVYQKFYDYHLRNRTMQRGETVLMDLGFDCESYKGDGGRTIPVSGHFTPEQREVIDLMNGAYQAGLRVLHDGVSSDDVIAAAMRYVESHKQNLRSDLAKRAAAELLKPSRWIMYTHGIDMVEIIFPKVMHAGNTLAFGPDFDVDGQGFYQEDVILITANGHELINSELPYSASDIERAMARAKAQMLSAR